MNFRKSPQRPLKTDERRRTFTDDEGNYWDVREVKNPDYDRRGGRSLLFESSNAVRRVRNYPDDWYDRSEKELQELSRRK